MFDLNDFDETLSGPWEWDLKRLAASIVLAGRHSGIGARRTAAATAAAVDSYRGGMRRLAEMTNLGIWYERVAVEDLRRSDGDAAPTRELDREVRRARRRTNLRSFEKLAEVVDGRARIRSDPPLLIPLRDLPAGLAPEDWRERLRVAYEGYEASVHDELRALLARYLIVDVAVKVVGVGSVGTRCFVVLLVGRDHGDPLFLQVKEAGPSVLEDVLGPSPYANCGRRVVEGQRLMQSYGDLFLGWCGIDAGRDFYWRQLKDMKGSVDLESMDAARLSRYAGVCGWTMARAHARSGDPVAISAYLGRSRTFTDAMTRFAEAYADQAEADHAAFLAALESGRLASQTPDVSPVRH
jgi:uncharacterized protein (DUF2252 family)